MCVRHLIAIWEKDSISLWILELGICRSWTLTVVVCLIPLIPGVIIMGHSTIHPSLGIGVGGEWHIYHVFRLVTFSVPVWKFL